MTDIPTAISESSFTIFGVRMRCYVLDDGQRIINEDDMHQLLAVMNGDGPEVVGSGDMEELAKWMGSR